jgi:hypothetical protein
MLAVDAAKSAIPWPRTRIPRETSLVDYSEEFFGMPMFLTPGRSRRDIRSLALWRVRVWADIWPATITAHAVELSFGWSSSLLAFATLDYDMNAEAFGRSVFTCALQRCSSDLYHLDKFLVIAE